MKTETNHTPVPWLKYGHLITADDNLKSGLTVTICHMGTLSDNVKHDAAEIDANAKFIVQACNSHGKLLEACKLALEAVADPADWNFKARPALIAAIALASQEGK